MTICDSCKAHVRVRNKIYGDHVLNLVNIPARVLRDLPLEDLQEIYRTAKNGSMVCGDCSTLCRLGDSSCSGADRQNLKIYKSRSQEDTATMAAVLAELDRRIAIKSR